ncbi:MAG TPA: hypothetical protein VGS61_06780, partial [Acidimicrobiales bacterium]|nr:hypothetical protein [Acidimicrobiales bacterium]
MARARRPTLAGPPRASDDATPRGTGSAEIRVDDLLDPVLLLIPVSGRHGITDFTIASYNRAATSRLDDPDEEFTGVLFGKRFPVIKSSPIFSAFIESVATGTPVILTDVLSPQDTREGERRVHVQAIPTEAGLLVTWRDVTSSHETDARYRMLAQHSADIVIQTAPDGDVQWISPSVTAALGWNPADLVGKTV